MTGSVHRVWLESAASAVAAPGAAPAPGATNAVAAAAAADTVHRQIAYSSGGEAYQSAIESFVSPLRKHGPVAILGRHWTDGVYTGQSSAGSCTGQSSAGSAATATRPEARPDAASAPAFRSSMAGAFKNGRPTIFDLCDEPYPNDFGHSYTNAIEAWLDTHPTRYAEWTWNTGDCASRPSLISA